MRCGDESLWTLVAFLPLRSQLCASTFLTLDCVTRGFPGNYLSSNALPVRCFCSLSPSPLSVAQSLSFRASIPQAIILITRGENLPLPLRGVIMEVINDRRAGYPFLVDKKHHQRHIPPPGCLLSPCPSGKFVISRPHFCSPVYPPL